MKMSKEIQAYPLCWPAGWRRTNPSQQKRGKFSVRREGKYGMRNQDVTVAQGCRRVLDSLQMMGIPDYQVIVSTNLKVRLDGLPYSNQREPEDVGVAVYWMETQEWNKLNNPDPKHNVMAIDLYARLADNLAAVAATLEAMRAIERHGGAAILKRAFQGFQALPSPNDWRHVMGFEETPNWDEVERKYRTLSKQRHPDTGGTEEMMSQLNRAHDDARRELTIQPYMCGTKNHGDKKHGGAP